ncbi:MAG: NAD(P)/FAD-dependent oxidoreductase [Flavobacteriaceae bacterium]
MFDVIVIGGGAAGFFAALHMVEAQPKLKVAILEKSHEVLAKVKVSGGGRCNVTHAEFDPRELVKNYPRGEKELLGPFHHFGPADTVAFFERHGIPLKTEGDGRMFPVSDSSQTIIDFFVERAEQLHIKVFRHSAVRGVDRGGRTGWKVTTQRKVYECQKLLIATGSSPKMWQLLKEKGHAIVSPVPSLFTFNCTDPRIKGVPGVSTRARIEVHQKNKYRAGVKLQLKSSVKKEPLMVSEGPVLVTHWGFSGPAVLKLSAWGAQLLNELNYHFPMKVNWLPDFHKGGVVPYMMQVKEVEAKKTIKRTSAFDIPKRLWGHLVLAAGIGPTTRWADATKVELEALAEQLVDGLFFINGKSLFKEEFVTAGGVDLKEVDLRTMESKLMDNVYFAGEVINVDAITGGFNFQNAWTTGYLAAKAIAGST